MAKKTDNFYTDDSITHLAPREFMRLRPATYLGSNEYNTQLVREIFSNSFDEHIIGHGNEIDIRIDTKTNTYELTDSGQGFPINVPTDDGKTVLQQAFDTLNTSGKFDDSGIYEGSAIGLNGIGTKLTNFLSKELIVETYNANNEYEKCVFKDGIFEKRTTGKAKHASGTTVTWHPDEQFFQNNKPNIEELAAYFEEVSALSSDLKINLTVDGDTTTYYEPGGIPALLESRVGNKKLLDNVFTMRKEVGSELFDIALTFTTDYTPSVSAYVNYGATEEGVHITTFKRAFTKALNDYAKSMGILKNKEGSLSFEELSEGLVVIFNLKAKGVKYDAQVKTRVVDIDKTLLNQVMSGDFATWLVNNAMDAQVIIERAAVARRARKAANDARAKIRDAVGTTKKEKKFIDLPSKLVDAWSKKRKDCELMITEGDSAANGLVARRNGEFQAVFPIRGKILSCRKATNAKIFGNQEVANIVKAIGLQVDEKTGKLKYDAKKLRYGKIIFMTDADADGYDIRLLLLTMFWELCPELVFNGHIYVAIPPLFRVTTKKGEYIFLTGKKELDEYKDKHAGESFLVNRNKGLGEQSPEELEECLLNPSTRKIEKLECTEEMFKEVDDMLEMAKGPSPDIRRDYLLKYYDDVENGLAEEVGN